MVVPSELLVWFGFLVLGCQSVFENVENATISTENITETTTENAILKFATPCLTPNNDAGLCIEIRQCPVLWNEILVENNSSYLFIRSSKCGPQNEDPHQPKVCCGKHSIVAQAIATPPTKPVTTSTEMTILPKTCGVQEVAMANRIFGGNEANLGEFPWMARLRHQNNYGYKTYSCSGFLILPKYVLTAAHCIVSSALEYLGPITEVQLGEYDTRQEIDCMGLTECAPPPQIIRVGRIIPHPGYLKGSQNRHNDIAIVPLKKAAEFTKYVQPICLQRTPIMGNAEFWLSGWGRTETSESSSIKLRVALPKVNFSECVTKYQTLKINLVESQICAGGHRQDSCSGDSGGPLMIHREGVWYAAGIVSFGVGCGREGWPGVYTNIPAFVSWVEGIVERRLRSGSAKSSNGTTNAR